MESVNCPICEISDCKFVFESSAREFDPGAFFKLVRCLRCGLVRVDPRPSQEELVRYYPDLNWFRAANQADPLAVHILGAPWRNLMRDRAASIQRVVPGPARLLEVGCGDGYFLRYMQDLGWQVEGIEPGKVAAAFARTKLGLKVSQGTVWDLPETESRYDAIYLHHVFEHIADPANTLRRFRSMLTPGGWLYIATPNWNSLDRWIFGKYWMALKTPQHLFLYNRATLTALLAKTGFSLARFDTYSVEGNAPALGYTESLRNWLSDLGWYPKRPALADMEAGDAAMNNENPFRSRVAWKRGGQIIERGIWGIACRIANPLGLGTSLRAWAQRT